MKGIVEIDFEMPELSNKYRKHLTSLYYFIAAQMQTNRGLLFDAEGGRNGHQKWAPLKFRNGQILSQRGTLRKSLAPSSPKGIPGNDGIVRFTQQTVTIGTNLYYARLMNDGTTKLPGGVLKPVNAKALRIPLPSGKSATPLGKKLRKTAKKGQGNQRYIFVKSVKIPERRFDEWTEQDELELNVAVTNKIADILNL